MERMVTVWYEGALAFFSVAQKQDGSLIAHLLKYTGNPQCSPPAELQLHKEGRHWANHSTLQDLADDIGYAIEAQKKDVNGPVYDWRKDRH